MHSLTSRFLRDESGATATEYAMLLVFVALAIAAFKMILVVLFLVQSRGTAKVGKAFGPIMLIWFATMAMLGIVSVLRHPQVLGALNPIHGLRLLDVALNDGVTRFNVLIRDRQTGQATYQHIKAGKMPPSPIIDSGVDVVTAANVDDYVLSWKTLEKQ